MKAVIERGRKRARLVSGSIDIVTVAPASLRLAHFFVHFVIIVVPSSRSSFRSTRNPDQIHDARAPISIPGPHRGGSPHPGPGKQTQAMSIRPLLAMALSTALLVGRFPVDAGAGHPGRRHHQGSPGEGERRTGAEPRIAARPDPRHRGQPLPQRAGKQRHPAGSQLDPTSGAPAPSHTHAGRRRRPLDPRP